MGNKVVFRPRNPEATKEAILAAARAEFAEAGLAGARVDSIAERSNANKRMIYHYFGDYFCL
jgi:AcrR family transcriptional regulator